MIFIEMMLELVMDMEVDKVADEMADMEVDMEVDWPCSRGPTSIVRGASSGTFQQQVPQWHSYLAFSSSQ